MSASALINQPAIGAHQQVLPTVNADSQQALPRLTPYPIRFEKPLPTVLMVLSDTAPEMNPSLALLALV